MYDLNWSMAYWEICGWFYLKEIGLLSWDGDGGANDGMVETEIKDVLLPHLISK